MKLNGKQNKKRLARHISVMTGAGQFLYDVNILLQKRLREYAHSHSERSGAGMAGDTQ